MCGRYAIAPRTPEDWATVGEWLGPRVEHALAGRKPQFNIAPTTRIPLVLQGGDRDEILTAEARWGFIPHWWKEVAPPRFSTINARSEEASAKPLWREAWLHARCLIPATHWYEWRKDVGGKQPFALQAADRKPFLFAGLYSRWRPPGSDEVICTAAILTRPASPGIEAIHDRMPVILQPRAWRAWMDQERATKPGVLEVLDGNQILEAHFYPVSTRVNAVRHQGPELLDEHAPAAS
ncbi:MAG TPA: SOS response-associated peptidase [Rhodanobacteraceae bacterium]|nr:SOS response-associated peptidase [Rhodanobacteraceae bacterium]